ncbi:MAG: VOC family protein [Succinivibrio sp.]|uniref:VOC family protein n=1 Tax=Succinivibrio faecicola TaxID=2820300 RepID=A0ABS7DG43_9GAMM|nr:VOC family protein [Succinivibrio faecicola]MBW7569840.1 VOC family protein [Succinivibrio faecicola]
MKIEHIAAWCNDLEKTKEFFVKFFEARSNEKYVNKIGFESYFLSFDSGARLELMHMDSISDYGHYNERFGFVHLAISVGSQSKVDKLTKQIVDAGYKLLSGPRRTGDGYYESCIQAEDNLIVEITI